MVQIDLQKFNWWYAVVFFGIRALYPISKAVAVVIVARCVDSNLAKVAIPLILKPQRLILKSWNTREKKATDPSREHADAGVLTPTR
jgi:hypothetical protein